MLSKNVTQNPKRSALLLFNISRITMGVVHCKWIFICKYVVSGASSAVQGRFCAIMKFTPNFPCLEVIAGVFCNYTPRGVVTDAVHR